MNFRICLLALRNSINFAVTFALAKALKIVRGLRQGLAHEKRGAVVDATVKRIVAKPCDPWKLNEELPPPGPALRHGSPENWNE